jgi:hypothetical protein
MGCRGGELGGDEIDIIMTNEPICEHIKENWGHYTHWADKAAAFCAENEGDTLQVKDVLSIIERTVVGFAAKTGLNAAVRKSSIPKKDFISMVACAVYESPKECSNALMLMHKKCKGK